MLLSSRLLTLFVILNCLSTYLCLKANFKENHNIAVHPFKTRINKRDISQFFDKASYSFNGFKKIEPVPIIFPLDICIFEVNQVRHYACLHVSKEGARHFVIFRSKNETYEELINLETPLAISMDCKTFGLKGFVALGFNITTSVERANKGSPIFQVDSERVKTVQYFGSPNLRSIYLRTTANDLFLLQSFVNTNTSSNLFCPYFKWSGYGFNKLGRIPCSNARHLEPFNINTESYVAIANYADQHGRTETNSEIYKYDREKKKLICFQKIKTNGAVDVRYFSVPFNEAEKHHFLIFGNSHATSAGQTDQLEADSVIYKFEKGSFIPYQMLPLYSVQKFLPVENVDLEKFILLVACSNQDIKIYNLNDWKFEESKAQFTEGALGKGVSNMRIFKHDEYSYLVIANERMLENATNVFLPIFTQEVHANTLRQQIIDWTAATIDRLSEFDVIRLKNDVQAAAKSLKERKSPDFIEIPSAKVEIAYTRSLINPARNFTTSYWKTLSYAYQAIEALEVRANKKLAVKRDASDEDKPEYTHEILNIGTLVVRNKLNAKKVNGVDPLNVQLKTASASKIIINGDFQRPPEARSDTIPEFLDTLSVDHLKISGKLNQLNWADLQANVLKKSGQQFLKAVVNINNLQTDTLVTSSDTISGQNLSKLVLIDGGSYVINQDIHFSKTIYAKNVTIKDRLNNIHVLQDKLDVLLVDSDETQHITGRKSFENIRLLEPVTIQGKILGELDIMSPFKPIHQSLDLIGHYTITGDVTIKEILSAKNIIGASGRNSFKRVLDEGLRAFGHFDGLRLNFEQPIEANNSIVKLVNGHDLHQLVRTDSEEVQIIEGHKTFKGDLKISKGFAEVKFLNKIDTDQLEKKILMKTGQQNITGNVRFKRLLAKRITSPSILLKGKALSTYLTKSEDQTCQGSLKVDRLKTQFATFGNLQTEKKVFDGLLDTLKQKEVAKARPEIFQNYEGTIHVQNLKVGGFINENSVENIERLLTLLNGNIKYVGGMKFHHDMKVSNLTFTGKFNGIPAEEFGSCWLQQGVEQVFATPQIFSSISTPKGLELSGKLNEYDYDDFISGSYRIDRDEHITNAVFKKSIQVEAGLTVSTINGLRVPEDILVQNSEEPQVLKDAMICSKDVHVKGNIQRLSSVNNMNLALLNEYLDSDLDTITVQHAAFENPPIFGRLNSHDIKGTIDTAWFANADVDLQHHVEIADGYFDGPLEFEGPINGMNMKYLKENYFSLSKPQQISAEMIFSKQVVFENDIDGENLHVYGPIIDATSNSEFEFTDFARNTLLKSGKQKITGQWKIYEGLVTGDLNNVRINDLNLAEDVIRLDVPLSQVTSPKYLQSASIKNIYSEGRSTVNGVNLLDWVHNAVFVYENYTIHGKTTLDSVIFYNDVQVSGTVNNINFNEHTLLLRDREQVIHGNIQIVTKYPEEKRILANSFGELNALSVNGLYIDEFFRYQAVGRFPTQINGSITFMHSVNVEHFDGGPDFMDLNGSKTDFNSIHDKTVKTFGDLKTAVQIIGHSYQSDQYYLSHFEHKQTIHVAAKKVISLTLRVGEEFVDVIGILKENYESNVLFYRWDFYQQQFVIDKHLSWLPQTKTLIDIFRVAFGKTDYLAIEKSLDGEFYQNVVSTETVGLQEIFKNNTSRLIEALELDGEHCFVVYKEIDGVLSTYCVEMNEKGLQFVRKSDLIREGILQIVSLENDYIAALLPDSVEIWKPNEPEKPKQKITAVSPSQIAAVVGTDSTKYIAICSKITPKSFHHGSVDIYKSLHDTPFEHMQTIDAVNPLQVELALLPESQDILLNILTESFDEPVAIYQYKGVVGFQPIVGSSTIPPGTSLSIVHLKASQQHLIAVLSHDDITFIESVLSKT